jgi:AmmeMemoRadiSam system protein B
VTPTERREPRAPVVAGAFYPRDATALHAELQRCFRDPRGPGRLPDPQRRPERRIRALVAPHAGYAYSGPIAALAFGAIAEERPPTSVLVLGVNHHGLGAPAALSSVEWETPLGPVPSDPDLARALAHGPIERDERAHAQEHSIEVELPFLQYVLPHPRVVELSVSFGTLGFLAEVGAVVGRAVAGRDVLLVASTDFSHYLPAEEARRLDRLAIEAILDRSAEALYRTVVENDISMCGIAPTTVLLAALEAEPLGARLLRWGHSGEAERMDRVVGYAALTLESESALEAGA